MRGGRAGVFFKGLRAEGAAELSPGRVCDSSVQESRAEKIRFVLCAEQKFCAEEIANTLVTR